jgi:hypothetical protein
MKVRTLIQAWCGKGEVPLNALPGMDKGSNIETVLLNLDDWLAEIEGMDKQVGTFGTIELSLKTPLRFDTKSIRARVNEAILARGFIGRLNLNLISTSNVKNVLVNWMGKKRMN